MTKTTIVAPPPTTDPVVIYDILIEAQTRLYARFAAQHPTLDPSDSEQVVEFGMQLDERVDALDVDDLDAQRRLTEQFKAEYTALGS